MLPKQLGTFTRLLQSIPLALCILCTCNLQGQNPLKEKASKGEPKQLTPPLTKNSTARNGFPVNAFEYTKIIEEHLGVPPRVILDKSIEIPIYVDGKQSYGNFGNQCDNPTYLGKETISGSTLQRYEGRDASGTPLPHVVWVSFGRNASDDHRRVIGSVQMIGYNRNTGATAFFESSDQISQWVTLDRGTLRMRGTLPWIDDPEQFNRAFRTPGTTQCVQCHQNDPFITNDFITAAKIPETQTPVVPILDQDSPYFVLGGEDWDMRTLNIRDNACLDCHRIGMSTLSLFMRNGWDPNEHMPPTNPGSLADDLNELIKVWNEGPEKTEEANWVVPPMNGQPMKSVVDDYPNQAFFNDPNYSPLPVGRKNAATGMANESKRQSLSQQLKAMVDTGTLSKEDAEEIFQSAFSD